MTYEQEMHLNLLLQEDTIYQELLSECAQLEEDYRRIMSSLPTEDREILERYIALCEELDHRRVETAYLLVPGSFILGNV